MSNTTSTPTSTNYSTKRNNYDNSKNYYKYKKEGITDVVLDPNDKDPSKYLSVHDKVTMNTYGRVPGVVFTHGKDSYLWDMKGTKYLDFGAGIAVNALGHSNDIWVQAVTEQASKVTHLSNLYYNQPAIELAQLLIGNNKYLDKVFFANSGTESNEAALKFAKKVGLSISPEKYEIISFTHGFSGRSMGSLSCTHKAKYRSIYGPLLPGVHFAEYNNLESVKKLMDPKKTAAVIIEPVQGEGGLEAATKEFMAGLYQLCQENKVMLILDEVQCGLGRTGNLWAHERFLDVCRPDMMTLAKPLAGGLPIGAILVNDHVAKMINPGDHGTTFGGGPLITHVGKVVFQMISNESFLQDVRDKGDYLRSGLERLSSKHPGKITAIRTVGGLFIGVDFNRPVKEFIDFSTKEKQILFISAGDNTIRFCPPLTCKKDEIDQVLNCIDEYLTKN
eukprot:gene2285-2819_t